MKIYTSKSGRKFSLVKVNRPAEGEVVFFLEDEFLWIKNHQPRLEPSEFDCIWELKKADHMYNPIPEKDNNIAKNLADKYASEIINMLRGKKIE